MMEWIGGDDAHLLFTDADAADTPTLNKEEYDDAALDLLALVFTLIKILYLKGQLGVLPSLFRLVEPTRM